MRQFHSAGKSLRLFVNHSETRTVASALALHFTETQTMSFQDRVEFFDGVPLEAIGELLTPDGARWSTPIEARLRAAGYNSDNHMKAYPGVIRRFVERASQANSAAIARIPVLSEWEAFQEKAREVCPTDTPLIQNLLDAGITKFCGYEITTNEIDAVRTRLQNMLSCANRLARQCSELGLTPAGFGELFADPKSLNIIPILRGKEIGYYYVQMVWTNVARLFPSLNLKPWPDVRRVVSLGRDSYPENLMDGLEDALFLNQVRRPATEKSYRAAFNTYFGVLEAEGLSLIKLTKGLAAKDALRVVTQGFPRELLSHDADMDAPLALARRMIGDREFRDQVIDGMRQQDGNHSGREAVTNPFLAVALESRRGENLHSTNRFLMMRISLINISYFDVRGPHYAWIKKHLEVIGKELEHHESDYDGKKAAVFRRPEILGHLLLAMADLSAVLIAQASNPTPAWVNKVGDAVLVYLMLIYPMRREQFNMMELGKHLDPLTFDIHFDGREVKNGKPIEYRVPRGGLAQGFWELLEIYLRIARPMKLNGRTSNRVFVPAQNKRNAGLGLRLNAINDLLPAFVQKHLRHILPQSLWQLNPHLIRHIVAADALVFRKSLSLAAQLLNDDPETVLRYYSDVLGSAKETLLNHFEGNS